MLSKITAIQPGIRLSGYAWFLPRHAPYCRLRWPIPHTASRASRLAAPSRPSCLPLQSTASILPWTVKADRMGDLGQPDGWNLTGIDAIAQMRPIVDAACCRSDRRLGAGARCRDEIPDEVHPCGVVGDGCLAGFEIRVIEQRQEVNRGN